MASAQQPDFAQKRKQLFDCLENAEKSLIGSTLHQTSSANPQDFAGRNERKRQKPEVRTFRQKESIFKRPELPITKCLPSRRVPDYQMNPHKWKKYSLEDADISDNANTSAALAFLKEMDRRKDDEEKLEELPSKIEFKKSVHLKKNLEPVEEEGTSMRGTKVVMPEYCIGQKVPKKSRKRFAGGKLTKTKELKLNHLIEEEDEDE